MYYLFSKFIGKSAMLLKSKARYFRNLDTLSSPKNNVVLVSFLVSWVCFSIALHHTSSSRGVKKNRCFLLDAYCYCISTCKTRILTRVDNMLLPFCPRYDS